MRTRGSVLFLTSPESMVSKNCASTLTAPPKVMIWVQLTR